MKKFLLVAIALIFVASCAKDSGTKGSTVVKVGGKAITQEDVQAEINALPEMAKAFFQGAEGTERFIDELVKKEMLYLEAQKRGLGKSKDFQRQVEEFKKLTLINQLLEKEMEAASKITEQEIKDYYDNNKDEFTLNNQIRLSHIVVKTDDEARQVLERLQKGEDFAKVASALSQDKASAKSGGDIGIFKRGEMVPELESAAFSLKKGAVSMPVKLKDSIHILKVTDAKGTLVEFEKVKSVIGQKITAERQQKSFDKLLEDIKKNYKVEKNKDAIAKLKIAPAQPHPPMQIPQMK
jgi:peptidyl-prolyl cis-trans isomerase C